MFFDLPAKEIETNVSLPKFRDEARRGPVMHCLSRRPRPRRVHERQKRGLHDACGVSCLEDAWEMNAFFFNFDRDFIAYSAFFENRTRVFLKFDRDFDAHLLFVKTATPVHENERVFF